MQSADISEQIDDPVGHISISGIHGRDELDKRLATAPARDTTRRKMTGAMLLGVAIGAVVTYLVTRD
jgi:hypothetical protein